MTCENYFYLNGKTDNTAYSMAEGQKSWESFTTNTHVHTKGSHLTCMIIKEHSCRKSMMS